MSLQPTNQRVRVGLFPFGTEQNPYQRMIAEALIAAGHDPVALAKANWFALRRATAQPVDILQLYWPHSLYHGRSRVATALKRLMLIDGLATLNRVRFVYSVENLFPHDAADEAFEKRMIQRFVQRADGHIVMARSAEKIFRQTYRLKAGAECYFVPHRNYLDIYPNQISRAEARRALELPEKARVVLFLGRLLWYKGLDRLIPAFLKADQPDAVLLLVGKCADMAMLQQLKQQVEVGRGTRSGQVRFDAGFVADDRIQVYMNAADVVVLPYADMPMNPGSLIMAMGFGRPVVSPAKGVTTEIAGTFGCFAYDERSAGGLQRAIEEALGAGNLDVRGAEMLDRARTNHSLARVSAGFREAYERLCSRSNHHSS